MMYIVNMASITQGVTISHKLSRITLWQFQEIIDTKLLQGRGWRKVFHDLQVELLSPESWCHKREGSEIPEDAIKVRVRLRTPSDEKVEELASLLEILGH